jgi:uncharacterized lipoprotein YmbA
MTMRTTMLSIIPIVLVTSACFSLSRETPPLRQYVLGGAHAAADATPSTDTAGLTVGLRRLDITPYLASPFIVVRRGAHQMLVSDYHRWGEDPVAGINRAFALYLAATTPVRAVDVAPWPVRSRHDFIVQLHISRFEGVTPEDTLAMHGEAHLLASWELLGGQGGVVLARGGTDYRAADWRVGDYHGLVTLLDAGLNRMAGEVVACMARVSAVAAPAAASAVASPPAAAAGGGEQPLACGTAGDPAAS